MRYLTMQNIISFPSNFDFALQLLWHFPLEKVDFILESFKIAKLNHLTMQNISSIYALSFPNNFDFNS